MFYNATEKKLGIILYKNGFVFDSLEVEPNESACFNMEINNNPSPLFKHITFHSDKSIANNKNHIFIPDGGYTARDGNIYLMDVQYINPDKLLKENTLKSLPSSGERF